MTRLYEETMRIPFNPQKSRQYKVEIDGNEIVVSKATEWEDVTAECRLEYRESRSCSGKYIAIMHGKPHCMAAIVGVEGVTAQHGFKVLRSPGATYSFTIYKQK